MMIKVDKKYKFFSAFDPKTGFYVRSGVIENNKDTGIDPFMASYPELIDVGIMGHCVHGKLGLCLKAGVQCYQSGRTKSQPNMSFDNFRKIIDESKGKTFQVALGGRGDPDQHEDFEKILVYSRLNGVVPNYTSSGLGFKERIVALSKEYCGAVAISWYRSEYTLKSIEMLIKAGVKTNIHYVLGQNTIDEAIERLENNGFPEGVNAIIFLLHKPVGLGKEENVLKVNDPRVRRFFEVIDTKTFPFRIGFDACSVPGLIHFTRNIDRNSFDTCEAARWSMYISPDMKALPCSFDQDMKWAYDISHDTIENAWNSSLFEEFREHFRTSCPTCKDRAVCLGGCPIKKQIVLCERKEKCRPESMKFKNKEEMNDNNDGNGRKN